VTRYWVAWWSDQPLNAETPFRWWGTGPRQASPVQSYVALLDEDSEADVWEQIGEYFPDYERRYTIPRARNWQPPERFQ
jgi:hypothetical protein